VTGEMEPTYGLVMLSAWMDPMSAHHCLCPAELSPSSLQRNLHPGFAHVTAHQACARPSTQPNNAPSEHFRESTPTPANAVAPTGNNARTLPGVFFFYDLSPIKVLRLGSASVHMLRVCRTFSAALGTAPASVL
jgi:hypothetical protein